MEIYLKRTELNISKLFNIRMVLLSGISIPRSMRYDSRALAFFVFVLCYRF